MSRLRVSNRPDGWLDEGPQVVPAHRGQHLSGSLVVGYTPRPVVIEATTPTRRAQMAAYKERKRAEKAA